MNKILRKSSEFGLLLRMPNVAPKKALHCVKSLKKCDLPIILINANYSNWADVLKEIAFNEDLFIAVENLETIEQIYLAAANGAQFYILNGTDHNLINELIDSGFYLIPRVNSIDELSLIKNSKIEAVLPENNQVQIELDQKYHNIVEYNGTFDYQALITIVDIQECDDYELWGNNLLKQYLGLNYIAIKVDNNSDKDLEFAQLFSTINRCKLLNSQNNEIIIECNDINRTLSYFKWKNLYMIPINTQFNNNKLYKGELDLELKGFKLKLQEKIK